MFWLCVTAGACDALSGLSGSAEPDGSYANLIPIPAEVHPASSVSAFEIGESTAITYGEAALEPAADLLAGLLRPSTGYRLPVREPAGEEPGTIRIRRVDDPGLGEEGYELRVEADGITISAATAAGAIWGVQTLRQLLPVAVEASAPQRRRWAVPGGLVRDVPRYPWRGAMLDVARSFFPVAEVERFLDLLSAYKMNRLHLHLTDDQGWRLMIESWPDLARVGGRGAVGGSRGGYYTQAEYTRIVEYAAARGVVVVPEIEMPSHVHAALEGYPEIGCLAERPEPYTGMAVGFSTLCLRDPIAYRFVEEVLAEVAALTPGPFVHIGADESYVTTREHYAEFVPRVEALLSGLGKRLVGWEEIAGTAISPEAVVQHWKIDTDRIASGVDGGNPLILSPAHLAYLDSKYGPRSPIGRSWTSSFLDVRSAYAWDPGSLIPGANVIGIEGPLWTETVRSIEEVEYLAFPRLIGLAELGWAGAPSEWSEYARRLGVHGPRLDALGVNYYRSPQVPWR